MDYKKIFKSRATRQKVLITLSFIPDELMVRLQYWIKTGRFLNLRNPKRYTEKLQWYKLNYRDPLMVKCVDKYDVRKYVENPDVLNHRKNTLIYMGSNPGLLFRCFRSS